MNSLLLPIKEQGFVDIHFPVVGDPELDALSGMMQVMEAMKLSKQDKQRCLNYLLDRVNNNPTEFPDTQKALQS